MKTIEQRLAELEAAKLAAYQAHISYVRASVRLADETLANEMLRLSEEAARIERSKTEALVLVRARYNGGPYVTVYHRADNTCGRVRDRDAFELVLEGDAVQRGLFYCEACQQRPPKGDELKPLGRTKFLQQHQPAPARNGRATLKVAAS